MAERHARHQKESEIKAYIDQFIKEQEEYKTIKMEVPPRPAPRHMPPCPASRPAPPLVTSCHAPRHVQEIAKENAKIREYAEEVMAREQALRLEKQREQNSKDAVLEKMAAEMAARQKEAGASAGGGGQPCADMVDEGGRRAGGG